MMLCKKYDFLQIFKQMILFFFRIWALIPLQAQSILMVLFLHPIVIVNSCKNVNSIIYEDYKTIFIYSFIVTNSYSY